MTGIAFLAFHNVNAQGCCSHILHCICLWVAFLAFHVIYQIVGFLGLHELYAWVAFLAFRIAYAWGGFISRSAYYILEFVFHILSNIVCALGYFSRAPHCMPKPL